MRLTLVVAAVLIAFTCITETYEQQEIDELLLAEVGESYAQKTLDALTDRDGNKLKLTITSVSPD